MTTGLPILMRSFFRVQNPAETTRGKKSFLMRAEIGLFGSGKNDRTFWVGENVRNAEQKRQFETTSYAIEKR